MDAFSAHQTDLRDLYEVLGVPRDAGVDEVRRAYRTLALRYHPDRNRGSKEAEERFKELAEAFRTLSDPQRRRVYDRYGHEGLKRLAGFRPEGPDLAGAIEVFVQQFSAFVRDEIRDEPGTGGRPTAPRRVVVRLTLEEVASGSRKLVRLPCVRCDGSGVEAAAGRSVPCRECAGEGTDVAGGAVEVEVPPGTTSGETLGARWTEGSHSRVGTARDIIAVAEVLEDPRFVRAGADIVVKATIAPGARERAAELDVPTPTGTTRVQVPPGVGPGQALTVEGRGLPTRTGSGHGDLIVKLVAGREPSRETGSDTANASAARGAGDGPGAEPGGSAAPFGLGLLLGLVTAGTGFGVFLLRPAASTGTETLVTALVVAGVVCGGLLLGSLVLARAAPQVLDSLAEARNRLAAARGALGRRMRHVEIRLVRFLERERRGALRPLVARLGDLATALEHAGEKQIARLERIQSNLSRQAARVREIQPDPAWASNEGTQRLRESAWRAQDGFLAGGLLLLLAAGAGALDVWALRLAPGPLLSAAGDLPFPLSEVGEPGALPFLLAVGAIACGIAVQALERIGDGNTDHVPLVRVGPYVLALVMVIGHGFAFSSLSGQIDTAGILGISPESELAGLGTYLLGFAGVALSLLLTSLGYGASLNLRQALAAFADQRVVRRLRRHRRRIGTLPADLDQLRKRLHDLGSAMEGLSREVTDTWIRSTGLDPRDGTIADSVRASMERLAAQGTVAARPERRSRTEVVAQLAIGFIGFLVLVALGIALQANLSSSVPQAWIPDRSAALLALAGTLGFVFAGYLVRDALFGPSRAPSLFRALPGHRSRAIVATVVATAVLASAAAAGWLALRSGTAEGLASAFVLGTLPSLGVAIWSFNLDVWLLSAAKVGHVALQAAIWLLLATSRGALALADGLLAATVEGTDMVRTPDAKVRRKAGGAG